MHANCVKADPWPNGGMETYHSFHCCKNLAAKYLAIPATSASSERSFSKAGLTIGKLRTRQTGQHIDEINVLHCNSSLL